MEAVESKGRFGERRRHTSGDESIHPGVGHASHFATRLGAQELFGNGTRPPRALEMISLDKVFQTMLRLLRRLVISLPGRISSSQVRRASFPCFDSDQQPPLYRLQLQAQKFSESCPPSKLAVGKDQIQEQSLYAVCDQPSPILTFVSPSCQVP